MEIIIGREQGARRIHCKYDSREFNIGQAGSVPMSVSRQHCKLSILNGRYILENCNLNNVTYVDGQQISTKEITASSSVQLGEEKFPLPIKNILKCVGISEPQGGAGSQQPGGQRPLSFSLVVLEPVWKEYQSRLNAIQEEQAKKANQQRIQGIVSLLGMALSLLPIPILFRAACIFGALALGIYFFVQGSNTKIVQRQIQELNEEFAPKYKCPNPACGKPFGQVPYYLIRYNKKCIACNCNYTN